MPPVSRANLISGAVDEKSAMLQTMKNHPPSPTAPSLALAVGVLAALTMTACSGSEESLPPNQEEGVTIAEARALSVGTSTTVEGFVTVAPGTFNSATGDQGFALQDKTGGIYVTLLGAQYE
jgi:hypothetical protein